MIELASDASGFSDLEVRAFRVYVYVYVYIYIYIYHISYIFLGCRASVAPENASLYFLTPNRCLRRRREPPFQNDFSKSDNIRLAL